MKWVVQSNVYSEEGYEGLLSAIRDAGCPLTTVKVIPFIGELEPIEGTLPVNGDSAIVMGSYTLARVAHRHGWKPGSFIENLDFEIQRQEWGKWMLNHRAIITRFDSVPFGEEPFFLRPVHDTKAFTGFVCDWGYYDEWRRSIRRLPETADPVNDPLGVNLLDLATPVMTCPKLDIHSETRTWVVGGQVITASGYKWGTLKRYTAPSAVPGYIIDFAQRRADEWCPNDAFVLDVAETDLGLRIVEINNLNSAGFYLGDMGALVRSLEKLYE